MAAHIGPYPTIWFPVHRTVLGDCRLAIELCVFAAHVKRDPASAPIWVNASTSDAAYAAYRKKFKPEKLFPSGLHQAGIVLVG